MPVFHHLALGGAAVAAIVAAYVLINTLSAAMRPADHSADHSAERSDAAMTMSTVAIIPDGNDDTVSPPQGEDQGPMAAMPSGIPSTAAPAMEDGIGAALRWYEGPPQAWSGLHQPQVSTAAVVEREGAVVNEDVAATADEGDAGTADEREGAAVHEGVAATADEGDAATAEERVAAVVNESVVATVRRRDTLSDIFIRHDLNVRDAYDISLLPEAAVLSRIYPGQTLHLETTPDGALAALRFSLDTYSMLHVTSHADGFSAEVITRTPEVRLRSVRGTIWSSVFDAATAADLDIDVAYRMVDIFGWQVDFAREIRRGDQFTVIFEEHYLDGRKVGNGAILATELINADRRMRAIRHEDEEGRAIHYAANGEGIRRTFLRTPVKFHRVTSGFTQRRFHPILKRWRAHKGVDYGAPTGTPVIATGDGTVQTAARKGGYGNTVILDHGNNYTTLYAHLSRYARGVRRGARVQQGDVIGYVGSSGWSTGPHLHYEFRVKGVHRNPLTVQLPRSDPIPDRYREAFLSDAQLWSARLDQAGLTTVARRDTP